MCSHPPAVVTHRCLLAPPLFRLIIVAPHGTRAWMGEWDFPALPLLQFHPHLLEKEALMMSHFRRKSLGLGAGSAACHVAHPPGICLVVRSCPVSISQPQAATLSQHVLETQSTSQGFPSAWHGHSAVPKPSPKQWPVMISCAVSLCTLGMGQCPHVPIPAGVCQLPFIPG